ncbi:MAG: hypothetical protein IPQ06_00180 [Chitinophagaceae bacterium]|nr:hypothetical protein [Chitinophagaceae bacterium]MBL0271506.1 hypothetical protein [Chitinophagaceae bacterium]
MKKIIIISMLLIQSAASFSQPAPETTTIKTDYLKKSRTQNTTAWFLLSGGLVLGSISAAISTNETLTDFSNIFSGEERKSTNTAEILGYTGLATMLGSIPLFIAARKNKKKAMSLSFKNETLPQLHKGSFINQSVPSLTLKISL